MSAPATADQYRRLAADIDIEIEVIRRLAELAPKKTRNKSRRL